MIEELVRAELDAGPVSGGRILERWQASGRDDLAGRYALVYAALANLVRRGEAKVLAEGEGEALYARADFLGSPAPPPRPPGFPPTFALVSRNDLNLVDREVGSITKGRKRHLFEEIRRAVVADAERRAFHGERLPGAIRSALEELGPGGAVRRLLRDCERGRPVPMDLRRARRLALPLALLLVAGALALLRAFVLGVYSVPSNSMAPALCSAEEGGDARVLVNLLAYRLGSPRRGDVAVFRADGSPERLVKRVMGLPGERISFGGGDLLVDGERLVKPRALLDRVKAPLYSKEDLKEGVSPPLRLSWRWPGGRLQPGGDPTPEAVLLARVLARAAPASVTIAIDDGLPARHTVVLKTDVYGAGAAAAGREVASGPEFLLKPGATRELWATNADFLFRVELEGREVARAPLRTRGAEARIRVTIEGDASLEFLEIARDVHYAPRPGAPPEAILLGEDELLLLGDNGESSKDSRYFGPVRLDALLGRVFAVAWPPSRVRRVP